jgi:fatty-acyl-CoA synthase
MIEIASRDEAKSSESPAKAWQRALELTAPIARNRSRILPIVIEESAARWADAPALLSDSDCLTYRALSSRANQYARWALSEGIGKGEVVCLLMSNCPEYMAIWLGLTSVGVVVALLNTNLRGPSLAHSIRAVSPEQLIVSESFAGIIREAVTHLDPLPSIRIHAGSNRSPQQLDIDISSVSNGSLTAEERRDTCIDDLALHIYTSGTTGLPKAANISHGRVMQWSHWFAGMMDVAPSDRMYNCLPMYHSVGGVQSTGAMLVGGGSVVLREKFSASSVWPEIVRWDCTLFQYIGELGRYMLHTESSEDESRHRIRLACGNGLSSEIWDAFKERFQIPRILEFYAATEGSLSLFNVEGKRGSIGRTPPYLSHRFAPALVLVDTETGEPIRNAEGFCVRSSTNLPGEALSKLPVDPANIAGRFEGYRATEESEKKILRNVFAPGDAWVRTGDLMRKDEQGFFYFVDRLGDTFRWKGENVATAEVAETICSWQGIRNAVVYGVAVPGAEGRAGMAAIVVDGELDLPSFRAHLSRQLPAYARPLFLRILEQMEITGTFKYSKADLVRQGFNPSASKDPIYFNDAESLSFIPLGVELHDRIQSGKLRL